MATALRSGCDFFSSWGTEAVDIAAKVYAGTNQNGSVGPNAGTKMTFAGRYIAVIGATELAALNAQGISVFFYMENSGAGSIQPSFNPNYLNATTFAQGVADATTAKNWLVNTLGIALQPVYFTVDYDANNYAQANALYNYFSGVASIMGNANTGLYGDGFIYGALLQLSNGAFPTWFAQSRSSGWSGNGNFISGMNLWQWPPGYTPGGNVTINGHGVDGVFAYTVDFGQYPRPSNPSSGQLNTITVPALNTTFSQPNPQALIVPDNSYDQVMFSATFTTSVTNTVGSYSISGPATKIGQAAYPIGNFTYNGGTSWNDFGFIFSGNFGSFVGELPAVVIQPVIDTSGNISFEVAVNQQVGSAGTIPLTIHIALLKTYAPSNLPVSSVTQSLAYSNANPTAGTLPPLSQGFSGQFINVLQTYACYRRIASDNKVGTGAHTVNHLQGVVPNIMVWTQDTSNNVLINPTVWTDGGADAAHFGVKMTTTQLIFNVDAANLNGAYYRVYSDN